MEAFSIEHLTFSYPTRPEPALNDVCLTIEQGEFVVLCGPSGCGKTTLLRQLKPSLTPHGQKEGRIVYEGRALEKLDHRVESAAIGFVMQTPENQIVTDKVWHELAFGLESQGYDNSSIRLRVAEMATFFGIQTWFYRQVSELSGGQKQLLALASIMAVQPSVLILDEPTSQLDPIAATEFLQTVGRINRELGCTVILTEHRLEEALFLASRVIVMDRGHVISNDRPEAVAAQLRSSQSGLFGAMPVPMRVWAAVPNSLACPLSVRDGREWLDAMLATQPMAQAAAQPVAQPTARPTMRPTAQAAGPAAQLVAQPTTRSTTQPTTQPAAQPEARSTVQPAVSLNEVWFRYERELPDVIRGVSFEAYPGQITAVLGGNGTGKTTMLSLITGLNRPYRGTVRIEGQDLKKVPASRLFDGLLGVLPQNPQTLFTGKTVEDELMEMLTDQRLSHAEKRKRVLAMTARCRLSELLDFHPYDLSGGEQQRTALAKVLLLKPRILLLDEPTKGFDAEFKVTFAALLRGLTAAGVTVIMVSHDLEFCAEYADRCALFFDGEVITEGEPRAFFSGNSFYTSAANRMARHVMPWAITASDIIEGLGQDVAKSAGNNLILDDEGEGTGYGVEGEESRVAGGALQEEPRQEEPLPKKPLPGKPLPERLRALSPRRLGVAIVSTVFLLLGLVFAALNFEGLWAFISGGDSALRVAQDVALSWRYCGIILLITVSAAGLALALSWKRSKEREFLARSVPEKQKLSGRTLLATAMVLIAIPLTIFVGVVYLDDRRYYLISLLIIIEAMLPFAFIFEGRKPRARDIVVIAVLCAIAVAGRGAFFMLPQFKPVVALVIISAVAFGGESGSLVGAITGFVSNMFFGQGPWTPWQMFAFGSIGFLAGILFQKGLLSRSRGALAVFGALAAFLLYGGIMDTAMVLMFQPNPSREMFLTYYLQGIPFNLVHAVATVVFLLVIARPLLEKLDRVKVKYGLVQFTPPG
jgi:energy-coupling factor transport system ATP-binding protein